jgi:hypothetical protein
VAKEVKTNAKIDNEERGSRRVRSDEGGKCVIVIKGRENEEKDRRTLKDTTNKMVPGKRDWGWADGDVDVRVR